MKIAICDDESSIREILRTKIEKYYFAQNIDFHIDCYASGDELLAQLTDDVDVLFLDVDMPGRNGMETAAEIRKTNKSILLIFLTAYSEFVFESFKVDTFRYLLKPMRTRNWRRFCGLCSLIILRECYKIEKGSRRMLLIALEVRSVENFIWLGICVRGGLFQSEYFLMTTWFVFTIFMCYLVFFIVSYQIEERAAIEKRADIHVNSYEYYLHMEEEHLQVRKLYHEMKNHLMILENDANAGQESNAEQVHLFGEKLNEIQQFYHTGSSTLDILLFDGRMKAEAKGIEFEAVISEGCLDFMQEEDISVIFSNAIINAIEACEKITEGPKYIKIKAGKNLDDILIYVKNTVDPMRQKGSLRTGKSNKKLHGIGMTSIQECAERYHG